jgi:WD40 repeat protein
MPRPERPLDGAETTLTRFALELRALRNGAGRPGYRALADQTGYSLSTLSEAASGRSLPTLAVTLTYVQACSGDVEKWERRWHQVAAELAAESAPEASEERAGETTPYVGLAAFEPADSQWFFGREEMVADVVARVGRQRFVAVFGASGAGKSSILRAGLVAAWTAQGKSSALFTPGARPMVAYEAALASLESVEKEVLLVVDQFEEVFTLCHDEGQRVAFLDRLFADVRREDGDLRVLIGVRTDFYSHCAEHPALAEALRDSQFLVGPMTPDQLRSAVTRPAVLAGGSVETALLAAVIADCAGQPGVLPLLSHALRETWRRRSGSRMTLAGYQAAGGITHAIAQTAEQTYAELDGRGRQLAKSLFLRLTALGEGTGDTKRRVDTGEVDTTDPNLVAVLRRLTDARLVTIDGGHVEITHEALIRCWPRLSEWLARDRQGLRVHRQLTEAANQWNVLHRDRGALYRGTRLSVAQELAEGPVELSTTERDFLTASTNDENQQATVSRKRTNRLRVLVCLLSVLLVVAGTLSVVAVRARDAAQAAQQATALQRNESQAQAMLGQAAALSASDPATAAQLNLAAYRLTPSAQARTMVLQSAATLHAFTAPIPGGTLLGLSPDGRLAASNDYDTITLYALDSATHTVNQVATISSGKPGTTFPNPEGATFSPDGKLMVIDYMMAAPKLYDTSDPAHPKLVASMPAQGGSVAYFGSDRYLITESTFQTVWDLVDPSHPKPISTITLPPSLAVQTSTFVLSEDGRTAAEVIYGPEGDTIRVSDTGKPHAQLTWSVTVPGSAGDPIALSHGVLAVATNTGTVYLWRVSNPHDVVGLGTLQVKTLGFTSVAVSPDGTEAAVSMGNAVDAWDLTSAGSPHLLAAVAYDSGELPTTMLGFQTDRTLVAQIGNDASQALWVDVPAPSLAASNGAVADASFSPDGSTLAVDSTSPVNGAGTQLWNVQDPSATALRATLRGTPVKPTRTDDPALLDTGVGGVAVFSPKGHLLATGDSSHGRLWDVTDPDRPRMLSVLPDDPLVFSPDGRTVVGSDGAFWDVSDPSHPKQLPGLPRDFHDRGTVAFSPDGGLLAVADGNKVTLYRTGGAGGPKPTGTIAYPGTMVAFAATGRTLTAASFGGRVGLWDVGNPAEPVLLATLKGRKVGRVGPVFSPNGHYVAIPEDGGSTQVWNVQDPRHPVSFVVLNDATPVEFDPNGKVIAVYAGDGSLQLSQIDVTAAIRRLCAGTPTISRDKWSQYVPTLAYQAPCGTSPSRP